MKDFQIFIFDHDIILRKNIKKYKYNTTLCINSKKTYNQINDLLI